MEENKIYKAKLRHYEIRMSKNGDPYVYADFRVQITPGQEPVIIDWMGTLKPGKGREVTMRALLDLGLGGPSMLGKLIQGARSGALDTNREVSVNLFRNEFNNKITYRINYINPMTKTAMSEQAFLEFLERSGLQGELLVEMQKSNIQIRDVPYVKELPAQSVAEIPF